MGQHFPTGSFDAIVALYSLFHLPRAEHDSFIGLVSRWLRASGIGFLTVSAAPDEGSVEDDFFGSPMFWSGHPVDAYRELFKSHGLRILDSGELGHGFLDTLELPEEVHPFFVVERVDRGA